MPADRAGDGSSEQLQVSDPQVEEVAVESEAGYDLDELK